MPDDRIVDEVKYLNAIRILLNNMEESPLSDLLEGSRCAVESTFSFSGRRWNCYYTVVHFYVPAERLHEFTDSRKAILVSVADQVMPKDLSYDVMEVQISPLLDTVPVNPDAFELVRSGVTYKPAYGPPTLDDKYKCDVFMIMPFHEEFEPVYRKIVVPTVENLGFTVLRGDDPFSDKDIMHDIWSMLNQCKLVIADCTGLNPNVLYELGIAHTIGKPVIMLTQDLKELPFDVNSKRAIEYDIHFHRIDLLREQLTRAINSLLPSQHTRDDFGSMPF